jgi:succinate dehydrogenase / fumarate reductase cytochrome b subunit
MAEPEAWQPLSPHLQIYSPLINMVMSIIHRVTGAGLYFGTILFAWWLIALAGGPETYGIFREFAGSFVGRLVLFVFTFALVHHLLGGLRHFLWDSGRGFELKTIDLMSWATIIGSVCVTLLVWGVGYSVR